MEPQPGSGLLQEILPIWQRILQRDSLRMEDDFFAMGGNPTLAGMLLGEIARMQGREIPPIMIYKAPTVASMATMLEEQKPAPFPPLVLLKAGTKLPPIFLSHGMGGSLLDFFHLQNEIVTTRPLYGLQAQGVDGVSKPFDRVEDMAQFHMAAIREVQPKGPYFLIGYSLGGLVALEMAQRLTEQGEKIALLALLETYPHVRNLAFRERARLNKLLVKYHLSNIKGKSIREKIDYVMDSSHRRTRSNSDSVRKTGEGVPFEPTLGTAMQRVRDAGFLAWNRYQPRYYPGEIKFVKAGVESYFPDDPQSVWGKLAQGFECETVPGDHHEILTTHYKELAAVVSRFLDEVS
jgi:acetoacetyl-CoA synthetase